MSDEQVQWQETILHTGTVEERDAAFAAFLSNKNGQYFVHGGPRANSTQAKDRTSKKPTPSEELRADLLLGVAPSVRIFEPAYSKVDERTEKALAQKAAELTRHTADKTPAQQRAEDLARRMQESRERRAGNPGPAYKAPTPVKPDPSPVTEAERALKAFMGHGS